MATSDDTDLNALEQGLTGAANYANTVGTNNTANAQIQAAYAAILQNENNRLGDYTNLSPADYKNLTPVQQGSTGLAAIPQDVQAQRDQEAALAQERQIADSGGLTLADRVAQNQVQQTQNLNNSARQNQLQNAFAAKGQLGSGAQLSAELANTQNAASNANQAGETAAASAQARAMQAIATEGTMGRTMQQDQYSRDAAAATAQDQINARNTAALNDASKYNNTLAGQTYEDQLKKFTGEQGVTNSLNSALLGSGTQSAKNTTANGQATGGLINGISQGLGTLGGSPKGTTDPKTGAVSNGDGTVTNKDGTVTDTPTDGMNNGGNDNTNLQPDPNDPNPNPNPSTDPTQDDDYGDGGDGGGD